MVINYWHCLEFQIILFVTSPLFFLCFAVGKIGFIVTVNDVSLINLLSNLNYLITIPSLIH